MLRTELTEPNKPDTKPNQIYIRFYSADFSHAELTDEPRNRTVLTRSNRSSRPSLKSINIVKVIIEYIRLAETEAALWFEAQTSHSRRLTQHRKVSSGRTMSPFSFKKKPYFQQWL